VSSLAAVAVAVAVLGRDADERRVPPAEAVPPAPVSTRYP
jgi:hypothetical protein